MRRNKTKELPLVQKRCIRCEAKYKYCLTFEGKDRKEIMFLSFAAFFLFLFFFFF